MTAGLYFHFPYCRKKCAYCDFTSYPCSSDDIPVLVRSIEKEIALFDLPVPVIDTVYIGGGTPSLLSAGQVDGILSSSRKKFKMTGKLEISMEANPESMTPAKLKGWRAAGVNRISMGVQSLDDKVLRYLGRLADRKQALKAAGMLNKTGFSNINFDLMFGLPFQDIPRLLEDINTLISYEPRHFSLYSLHLSKGTPLSARMRKDGLKLKDDRDYYDTAVELLEKKGYAAYEISNFAKPGFECRHNLHYWNYDPYVGCGPAAVGFIGRTRWKNQPDPMKYMKLVDSGRLPRTKVEQIPDAMAENEYIMMNLRKTSGVDTADYKGRFEKDFVKEFGKLIVGFEANGLMSRDDQRCFITRSGRFVSNAIIREFFRN